MDHGFNLPFPLPHVQTARLRVSGQCRWLEPNRLSRAIFTARQWLYLLRRQHGNIMFRRQRSPQFPYIPIGTEDVTRILLAEDDEDMRRFLVRALERAGYEVVDFDNGASAYERLREEPFNLLLTDIVMPEMDGIELARRATEIDPDLKVMFITGFAAVALNPDSKAPKDAKILSKPFHLRELVDEVAKMLQAA